jgi:hypothetical protein
MIRLNSLSLLTRFLSFAAVFFCLNAAYASSCTTSVNTTSAGTDTIECSPASYCFTCVPCCTIASVTQISQDFFRDYRKDFIMDSFYTCPVETTFKKTADELRRAFMFRIVAMGSFLDASSLNDTMRDLQVLSSDSLKTYTPSDQICRFGTLSRSLAQSEAKVNLDRMFLSEVGLAKNLGKVNTISAAGLGSEFEWRLKVFAEKFCDLKDNETGLDGICPTATPSKDLDLNRDIDYTRLMNYNATINADMTDSGSTQDETNVVTLSHFLYGHRQPVQRVSTTSINESDGALDIYSQYRSVIARRAAAQNSYNTLVAMRMAGSGGSDTYMRQTLDRIGITAADADRYLGAKDSDHGAVASSYNAQMDLLTKRIFQDPAFYATLMESKANVKRTSASIQSLGLMQARDTYKSMTRSEMLLAILIELEARKISNNIQGTGN